MAKFHINSKGVPAPCKAVKGNCPFGGADSHYDTVEQAQEFADKRNEEQYGILSEVNSSGPNPPTEKELRQMYLSEVEVTLKDGTKLNGILSNNKKDSISLRLGGNKNKEVKLSDVQNMKSLSEYKYFSKEYKEELRRNNKARPEFRYAKEDLDNYKNTFISVEYDDKSFDGEVIDTHYEGDHNSGLIIQSENGEVKHIKNYRLTSVEHTGDNLREHKQTKRLKELEDFVSDELFVNIDSVPGNSDNDYLENPRKVIDDYFKAVIMKEKGLDVDLTKAGVHDWIGDVDDAKDNGAYDDASRYYHDRERGGGQYTEWSERSEEAYNDDLDAAEENEIFCEDRKELINDMVKEVKAIDWTPYYDTQKEGEIEALEYLYDSGIATDY